jgi:hypothetical protein
MMGRIDAKESTSAAASPPSLGIKKLALGWTSVVVMAVLIAAYVQIYQDETFGDEENLTFGWNAGRRSMLEYQYSSSTSTIGASATPHHHHKQVFSHAHEPLFPLSSSTLWGLAFAIFSLVIAAGGGIGGGGLLVPIYILIMGFSPKHAIPLSNVTVFGTYAPAPELVLWS